MTVAPVVVDRTTAKGVIMRIESNPWVSLLNALFRLLAVAPPSFLRAQTVNAALALRAALVADFLAVIDTAPDATTAAATLGCARNTLGMSVIAWRTVAPTIPREVMLRESVASSSPTSSSPTSSSPAEPPRRAQASLACAWTVGDRVQRFTQDGNLVRGAVVGMVPMGDDVELRVAWDGGDHETIRRPWWGLTTEVQVTSTESDDPVASSETPSTKGVNRKVKAVESSRKMTSRGGAKAGRR